MNMPEKLSLSGTAEQKCHRFSLILDNLDAVVYVTDIKTYKILYLNKYLKDIHGDATGRICWKTFQKNQNGPCAFCTNDKLVDAKGKPSGIYVWEHINTLNNRWYEMRDCAVYWDEDRLARLEIAVDITKRKIAQAQLVGSRLALSEAELIADFGSWKIDLVNNRLEGSKGLCRIIGMAQKDFNGRFKSFAEFIHPDDRHKIVTDVNRFVKKAAPFEHEYRIIRPDGKERILFARAKIKTNANGKTIRIHGTAQDITEKKKTEAELIKTRHELEKRVSERTAQLERVNAALEKKIEEQTLLHNRLIISERLAATGQLAASVAHEINSPLQGIISLLNSIKSEYGHDKKLMEDLKWIEGGYGKIRDTVKNLLDLNRPDNKKKRFVRINSVIRDTVSLTRKYLSENKIDVDLCLEKNMTRIPASHQQVGQVLLNLINNAVEAISESRENNRITIDSSGHRDKITLTTKNSDDTIVIEVKDTGPGIPDEDLEKVFDPFYTRRKKMGIGMGLSICHGIITDHGGTISAKNHDEKGAVFTITLPVRTRHSTPEEDEDTP